MATDLQRAWWDVIADDPALPPAMKIQALSESYDWARQVLDASRIRLAVDVGLQVAALDQFLSRCVAGEGWLASEVVDGLIVRALQGACAHVWGLMPPQVSQATALRLVDELEAATAGRGGEGLIPLAGKRSTPGWLARCFRRAAG